MSTLLYLDSNKATVELHKDEQPLTVDYLEARLRNQGEAFDQLLSHQILFLHRSVHNHGHPMCLLPARWTQMKRNYMKRMWISNNKNLKNHSITEARMKHLRILSKTRITRIGLGFLILGLHFLLSCGNKSRSILPWTNISFLSKQLIRQPNVSINVITKPNENLGIKLDYCIPDGLHKSTSLSTSKCLNTVA